MIDQLVGIYKEYINLYKDINKEWWVFSGIFNTISTRTGITFKKLQNLNLIIHEEIIIINNVLTTFKNCKFKNFLN